MRLPKPVYEAYPYLYVAGGIAASSVVETTSAFLCGILLSCGGVAILFMRRNYRVTKSRLPQTN
jgi:hypothetical protein